MMTPDGDFAGNDVLRQQSLAWLRLLTGGRATAADVASLTRWREASPDHGRAFAEAALLWEVMGDAAALALQSDPALAFAASSKRSGVVVGRRAFFLGGGALAASLAGVALVHPPLGLWPSFADLRADYRTRLGERRRIDMASQSSVELNTQTSIDFHSTEGGAAIELISGEAAVSTGASPTEIVVSAGAGRSEARQGSFNIRKDGEAVCVTCLDGQVNVRFGDGVVSLRGGQQVSYDDSGLRPTAAADSEIVGAWRHGLLIFRDAPLSRLIEEVNRYRSGKIVLLDSHLAQRRVVATFRLDRIDDAVTFVRQVMNVPARFLPGGLVLLG
ncbi:FecR family protein [Telmatospirillum siberiense]|uniref:Iron dicitrate transport regulator FecR n=1 Tax=Telmatospirillum siberiense TaxID=382514 RepID=A0A2N3PQB6_9PROT|nr:FecR domain-containing protein [Telmatospirillum siberiense]PKU22594.1 iron dicitrate transport regulator FecR [Telmatospirillum siberiense]